jgi:PEP-CTERM motif
MAYRFQCKLAFAAVAALLLFVAVPSWAGQVLIYAQNPDYQNLYASQNDTSGTFGMFAQSYDNFSLASAATLTEVQWVGGYYNPQSAGPITLWTVSFSADNSGQPGATLYLTTTPGNGSETFLQNDNLGDPVYLYTATVNFAAGAGTTYWLSVVPDLAFPPQWGWTTSSQGDGVAWQTYFGTGSQIPSDLAFSLYKTQQTGAPEPGSLMLLGSGIVGIAATLRRKLRS